MSEWFIKFQHKNKQKKEIKFDNSDMLKKFSKSLRNVYDLDPDPFSSSADPGSGFALK